MTRVEKALCVAFEAAEAVLTGSGDRFLQQRLCAIGLGRRALKQGASPFELRGSDQGGPNVSVPAASLGLRC